jgi:hypothetical protein
MSRQITIGLLAEGGTDEAFLLGLIERVYQHLIMECYQQVEVLTPIREHQKRSQLTKYILTGARNLNYYDILCIHCDADNRSDRAYRKDVLDPALEAHAAAAKVEDIIECIVPIIPIRTLENWILADTVALKIMIGTNQTDQTLGLNYPPESYNDPKHAIKQAIIISQAQKSGRRTKVDISELYIPMGQEAALNELLKLPSFQKFYDAARASLVKMNLLTP